MKILPIFVVLFLATFAAPSQATRGFLFQPGDIKDDLDRTGSQIGNLLSGTFWKVVHSIKHKPYELTSADRAEVKNCVITVNLRIWHHMKEQNDCEIPLTDHEAHCKRMATFKPGPNDPKSYQARKESTDRLIHLITEFNRLTSPYHQTIWPTWVDLQEIEDCFYNRDWQKKSEQKLNSHEALCRRIADFKFPNKTEALKNLNEGVFDITPYRKAWNKVPETGLEDYRMKINCLPEKMTPITDPSYNECKGYYVRARMDHWRQKRLSKYEDCTALFITSTGPSASHAECSVVVGTYKALYYSGKW